MRTIGKETRNLETQCLGVSKINEYTDEDELKKILLMIPEEAREKEVAVMDYGELNRS